MTHDTEPAWGGDLPDTPTRDVDAGVPDGYTPDIGRAAWTDAVIALGDIIDAARNLDRAVPAGCQYQRDALNGHVIVSMIAALQDVRRDLARTEAWLAREVGRDEAVPHAGVLPDGRQYEVRRGAVRKAWDHDTWKHDARAAVVREYVGPGDDHVILPETGEAVRLMDVVARAQEVHGSSAPRATALRRLGLDPDAYCESVPGSWSVKVEGDLGVDGSGVQG